MLSLNFLNLDIGLSPFSPRTVVNIPPKALKKSNIALFKVAMGLPSFQTT